MADLHVLHVVPRLSHGGAAPSLVLEAKYAQQVGSRVMHRVLALEPGGSSVLVREALRWGLRLHPAPGREDEATLVHGAHVVVLHFWNAPSVRRFLDRWRGVPLRWVLHSLVNGLHRPQRLPPVLCASACHVVLTNPKLRDVPGHDRVSLIPTVADMDSTGADAPHPVGGPIVHAGTINVFKLSPHFVPLHAPVADPANPVLVAGSGGDEERFAAEAASLGVAAGFHWLGFRFDLPALFSRARLLSYPASPFTYASADRVIQESQAAGVPVLIQRDAPVAHLVRDGVTGILAEDLDDFQRRLVAISAGREELPDRRTVSEAARLDHDAGRKHVQLESVYRSVEAGSARPLDDGFPTLASWIDYQIGDVEELWDVRRPPLSALRDPSVLARHQRWGCEGGLAQYINSFPELARAGAKQPGHE